MSGPTIAISGAGIGGLAAALCFARRGYNVDLIEQAPALSEVGAGLQLSPNATRILLALGLEKPLGKVLFRPQEITLVSGVTLKRITGVPNGAFAENRWGAPYGSIHRADLQHLLLDAVLSEPRCRLNLGQRMEARTAEEAMRFFRTRSGSKPDLIVGADGVWSEMRGLVSGAQPPRFSGLTAWRFLIPADQAKTIISPGNVTAWLGPGTHLVAYPLRDGSTVNMVAITPGKNPGQTWEATENPSDRALLFRAFADWNPAITDLLASQNEMTWWPLYAVADGPFRADGPIALIGDAAHALVPFSAQGAGMAIEDAWELAAACDGASGSALNEKLDAWEKSRRARVERVRRRTAFNRFVYHATGPVRIGRDMMLSLRKPEALAADLDWLYGWRASGL